MMDENDFKLLNESLDNIKELISRSESFSSEEFKLLKQMLYERQKINSCVHEEELQKQINNLPISEQWRYKNDSFNKDRYDRYFSKSCPICCSLNEKLKNEYRVNNLCMELTVKQIVEMARRDYEKQLEKSRREKPSCTCCPIHGFKIDLDNNPWGEDLVNIVDQLKNIEDKKIIP